MTDGVDALELLERIRRARDWAADQRDRALLVGEEPGEGQFEALPAAIDGAVFRAVVQVLDEILEPGSGQPKA